MNPDDKLKAAALDYLKDAYHEEMPYVSSLQSFLAGAAYRDPEIKALLEIVKMQREALGKIQAQTELFNFAKDPERVHRANDYALETITATDEKLKELGVGI